MLIPGGVIDNNYRGEIKVIVQNNSGYEYVIEEGDRIAQILFLPRQLPEIVEVGSRDELSTTDRGEQGFGSTGKSHNTPIVPLVFAKMPVHTIGACPETGKEGECNGVESAAAGAMDVYIGDPDDEWDHIHQKEEKRLHAMFPGLDRLQQKSIFERWREPMYAVSVDDDDDEVDSGPYPADGEDPDDDSEFFDYYIGDSDGEEQYNNQKSCKQNDPFEVGEFLTLFQPLNR